MKNLALFALLLLTVFACQKNTDYQNEIFDKEYVVELTNEEKDYLENMYYNFNQSTAIHTLSFQDQITRAAQYMAANGQHVYLNEVFEQVGETTPDQQHMEYLQKMHSIVKTYGFSEKSNEKLDECRNLILRTNQLSEEDIYIIDVNTQLLKFAINSTEFKKYCESFAILNSPNEDIESRCVDVVDVVACASATLSFVRNSQSCSNGNFLACIALIFSANNMANVCTQCSPDHDLPNDPCASPNPDPCCQVFCGQGYECNNGQCVYVGGSNCNNCLPGEFCNNGYCQPF